MFQTDQDVVCRDLEEKGKLTNNVVEKTQSYYDVLFSPNKSSLKRKQAAARAVLFCVT